MKRILILALFICVNFGISLANVKTTPSATVKKNPLIKKALAENAIFRCSFKKTLSSKKKGKELDKELFSLCKKEVEAIRKWYGKKTNNRGILLIGNGKRSALANRDFL